MTSRYAVFFDQPEKGISPGQCAVFYALPTEPDPKFDPEECLGGGWIALCYSSSIHMKMISRQMRGIMLIALSATILVGATISLRQIDASILALEPNATRPPLMLIAAVAFVLAITGVLLNLDLASARAQWAGSAWFRLGFCAVFGVVAIYSLLLVNRGGGPDVQRINGVLVEYSHGAVGRALTEEEAANSLRAFGQLWLGAAAWMSLLALLLAPIGIEFMRERLKLRAPKTDSKDKQIAP